MQFRNRTIGLGICFLLMSTGCSSRENVDEVKNTQSEILEKIGALEGGSSQAAPAPDVPVRKFRSPDPDKVYSFAVGQSPTQGPSDAWVTLVHVLNFQEPFSKEVAGTLKEIRRNYGDKLRLVFKHYPIDSLPRFLPAAHAAMCAHEQGKFWEVADLLFANQSALEGADLIRYSEAAKVDLIKWQYCYEAKKYKGHILNDQRTAAYRGSLGAPAFFINGRYIKGLQSLPVLQALIDAELDKAQKSGVRKAEYYETEIVLKGRRRI
jgi:protein-disulfide isomerase